MNDKQRDAYAAAGRADEADERAKEAAEDANAAADRAGAWTNNIDEYMDADAAAEDYGAASDASVSQMAGDVIIGDDA